MRIRNNHEINPNERCHWLLNRKVAEYISKPTQQLEITLRFLLTSYRALNEKENQLKSRLKTQD